MTIFKSGLFTLHSGEKARFKIDCDDLTDQDWSTLAEIIASRVDFADVLGVPTGGLKLEKHLKSYGQYDIKLPLLIVDDVYTTGKSMRDFRESVNGYSKFIGYTVFARRYPQEPWINSIFNME